MRRTQSTLIVLSITTVIVLLLWFLRLGVSEIGIYLDMLSALTAIIGIFAIWYQLKKDKELNEAQFIFELNNNFYENNAIMTVYEKCNNVHLGQSATTGFTRNDESIITQYFSFFGIINTFLDRGILNMELIDRTFAYRYFLVANQKDVQDLFLIKDAPYYRGNYQLYANWIKYRQKKSLPILFCENNLCSRNPEGFKNIR